jgi:MtN3 and saliva related transmembrane protein
VDVLAPVTAAWAVVMALAPVLQVRRMIATGSARSVSVGYFALLAVGFGLWIAYGAADRNMVLVVPNAVALAVDGATISVALHYRRVRTGVPQPRA